MAEIGSIIDGKYEILREIGKGGMSVVYLAMDTHLNKQWAVKEIRKKGFDGLSGFEKYCYLTFYGENEFVKDADAAMQECWDDIQNALNHLQYQTN